MKRTRFSEEQIIGVLKERTRRLIEQMELQLEDLQADACEDDLAAEAVVQKRSEAD